MKSDPKNIVRVFFLVLIFALWFLGMPDKWGPFLMLGLLTTPVWGRLYCGYVCPISTSVDILGTFLPAKAAVPEHRIAASNPKVVAASFFVSLFLLIVFIKTNFFIPFFIFMIPAGIIVTYLFGEVCWHRNCFFGTVFSWLGSFSRKGYVLKEAQCGNCGSCSETCPAGCLVINSDNQVNIDKKHCLVCGKCREACPQANIVYDKLAKHGG